MTKPVFWADIEYSNLDKTDSGVGGFVYAFVTAKDIYAARQFIARALEGKRKTIDNVRQLQEYSSQVSWGSPDIDAHYNSLVNSARQNDNVIFDTFYAYDDIE